MVIEKVLEIIYLIEFEYVNTGLFGSIESGHIHTLSLKATRSLCGFFLTPAVLASYRCTVSPFFKELLFTFCENEIFVTINAVYLFIAHTLSCSQW